MLPDTFCQHYLLQDALNIECKHNLTYSLRLYFYLLYLGGYFIRSSQTSPKVPVVSGT
jgi:hypothetical protein